MNTLVDLKNLGIRIKEDLIKEFKRRKGFSDDEPYGNGLILDCVGIVSLLLLKNGFEDELNFTEEDIVIINKCLDEVLEYIIAHGYDATPFQTSEKTKEYFRPGKGYHYYDSVSWLLSLTVQMWNANKLDDRLLSNEKKGRLKNAMKESLEIISVGGIATGGWGFTNNCDKPDLYYSYVISESLADFADYILGESQEDIGIREDVEIINFLGNELISKINDCRRNTSQWIVNTYIKTSDFKLGEVLINPNDTTGRDFKSLDNDETFPLIYYTYFVVDMLIVNNADIYLKEDKDIINKAIEHGIYLTRIYFDKAKLTKEDKDGGWWESKASQLNIDFQNNTNFVRPKNLSDGKIKEPGLVPLSLRCNILYSFYISNGQDSKIDGLFEALLGEKRDKNHSPELWDNQGYNILITERAIEGLIDYADYIRKYRSSSGIISNKAILSEHKQLSVDETVQLYIDQSVKKYLSPDIVQNVLITNTSTMPYRGDITKTTIVDLLLELFTDLEIYINPERRSMLDAKEVDLITDFAKKFSSWLKNIFYLELKDADKIKDKDMVIYSNYNKQLNPIKAIAELLREEVELDTFYEIIQNTIEKKFSPK